MFASSQHTCDQWHSSRKFTFLTSCHCKLCPNTEGTKMVFGGEIKSRAAVEGSVAKLMSTGKFGSESPVSTVLLSIQGGPGTLLSFFRWKPVWLEV
jgi:hypothetical protein